MIVLLPIEQIRSILYQLTTVILYSNRHWIKSCLVYTNLFKFDCETSNFCLCKSLSNPFLEPTSTKQSESGNNGGL